MSNFSRIVSRAIARKEAPIVARQRGVTVYRAAQFHRLRTGETHITDSGEGYVFRYVPAFRARPYTRPEARRIPRGVRG